MRIDPTAERRRTRVRVSVWALALVALALYLGFILAAVLRSTGGAG